MIGHEKNVERFKILADSGNLAHAYIFYGPENVGKLKFAVALAGYLERGVFSDKFERPLSDCSIISPSEGGSLGIDLVRKASGHLAESPSIGKKRVVIINNCESMTDEAENAILKIAEEPYQRALLILIIRDPEILLPTMRSRFQKIYFPPLSKNKIKEWLKEKHGISENKAAIVAEQSFGRPGLSEKILSDGKFANVLEMANVYVSGNESDRKNIYKTIMEEEHFDFDAFLEAIMMSARRKGIMKADFWHRLFKLRELARRSPLNARLQLTALRHVLELDR